MSESDTWPARWEAALGRWEMAHGLARSEPRELWSLLGEEVMRARAERAALVTSVKRIGARLDELLAERAAELDEEGNALVDELLSTRAKSEPQQYERRMGQPTQAPEQLVAVRPDLRSEATSDATADELRMELALLRQEHQAVRRALRAAKDDDAVELAEWYVSDGAGATLAEVREALGCEDGEDVVERAQDVFAAEARFTHVREALEAGQWARAAELAGCGGGDE